MASCPDLEYVVWLREDQSGSPLHRVVDGWIDDAEGFLADITFVNDNVTYEFGYAIGAGKNIRIIRNAGIDLSEVKQIGLFDTLLRDEFRTRTELESILRRRQALRNNWLAAASNDRQPVYLLSPPAPTEFSTKLFSAVKKRSRFKFRSFRPWEVGRLTAQEAWDQVSASFEVIVTWAEGSSPEARRNNQRAAFLFGLARGRSVPAVLLAHERTELPADLQEQATRFSIPANLDRILTEFRDEVQDELNDREVARPLPMALLDQIRCGDPAAENEQEDLRDYFLETEEFKRTLNNAANIVIGRKGSGKTAIFLQVRDRVRADRRNIVIDLNPEGYQLLKLKEMMLELQSQGLRREFIAAFWQYVMWLEIASAAERDSGLTDRYGKLADAFAARVDTGSGDFSERLRILTDTISERFRETTDSCGKLQSSSVLQIVYGEDIVVIREQVMSYLKLKGEVLFLFDNLDRMRSPSGFERADGVLLVGLIEAMQDITKQFRKKQFVFRWALFIRSDVYEFVVRDMADYGKHMPLMLEWSDTEVLKRILRRRIEASANSLQHSWETLWPSLSATSVGEQETFDFLVAASLMRPRYLIRLFETARRRAINVAHQRITEDDYLVALEDLGWTITEDLDLELRDIVQQTERLLFDLAQLDGACGIPELKDAIAARVGATDVVERVIDVLLWSGAIGIAVDRAPTFIYNCGYKLQALRSLMDRNPHAEVCLHPTLGQLLLASRHPLQASSLIRQNSRELAEAAGPLIAEGFIANAKNVGQGQQRTSREKAVSCRAAANMCRCGLNFDGTDAAGNRHIAPHMLDSKHGAANDRWDRILQSRKWHIRQQRRLV